MVRRTFWIVLLLCGAVWADGKAFSLRAFPRPPEIPLQRAAIVYRDGTETLLVESTFQTDSPEVGWVLPLPAAPTDLAPAEPGLLTSLELALLPEFVRPDNTCRQISMLVLLVCVPLAVIINRRTIWSPWVLVALLAMLFATFLFLPTLSLKRAGISQGIEAPGVEVLETREVGNYTASVLQADDAEALNDWLKRNGFAELSEADRNVAREYIGEKWVFVIARLRKQAGKPLTPHPIAATFPAAVPIYPMKFTALNPAPNTAVELFVFADRRADAEHFRCLVSDRFTRQTSPPPSAKYTWPFATAGPYLAAGATDLRMGHPWVLQHAWDGMVATRLTATLTPEQMRQDVRLELHEAGPLRMTFYAPGFRKELGGCVLITLLCLPILLTGFLTRIDRQTRRWEKGLVVGLIVLSFAAGAVVWCRLEPPPPGLRFPHPSQSFLDAMHVEKSLILFLSERDNLPALDAPVEEWQKALDGEYEPGPVLLGEIMSPQNPLTGKPRKFGTGPGCIDLKRIDGKLQVIYYDQDTIAHITPMQIFLPDD